jgi:cytosine/adenosine deaminase-related metal-dependent hydrolase
VIKEVDFMPVEKLVGPGGFKERILRETPPEKLVSSMGDTISDIFATGTQMFADFREGGIEGVRSLREALNSIQGNAKGVNVKIFGRPVAAADDDNNDRLEKLLQEVDGVGISSVADHSPEYVAFLAGEVKKRNKMFALHAGERNAVDIKGAIELEPDFIVHLTHAAHPDLEKMYDKDISAVICLRCNLVTRAGLPPLPHMLAAGLSVGMGTDNVMLNSTDMFAEMEFVSKIFNIEEKEVLKMCTLNAAKILQEEKHVGSIAEGKKGNCLVIKGDSVNMRGVKDSVKGVVRRARCDDIAAVIYEGEKYGILENAHKEWKTNL